MSSAKLLVTLAVLFISQVAAQRRPPNYSLDDMPETSFDCSDKVVGGYYADPEADCQMFHVCVRMPGNDVQDYRFLCPNDTMFDQENRICANWFDIDCEAAAVYYGNSFDLYRIGSSGNVDQRLTEIVASPSPIIALGPSTPRAPLANKPRTAGTGYYSNRRNGPRNNFETNNAADDEALIRSATGDRRLQNSNRQAAETETEQESYEDAPKRRNGPKKVALRKFSRTRGKDDAYNGPSTKGENAYGSSSSRVYVSSTTPVPTPEATTATSNYRNNYNGNFRGSTNYDGFPRGNNRNNYVSTTVAAPEPTANTKKFSNDYRGSGQTQQPNNYNFQQQRDYKSPSTAAAATTFGYSPSTTLAPPPPSFSNNFQNYQKPPSRPSIASTAAPQNTNTFGNDDRSPLPTTFSPSSSQNNYNNYNFNNRNANKNYDNANPAPTTYSPPTSKGNNYNSFANNNNYNNNNGNVAPTTYSPVTSKSTNYNPYTANFNNNYNSPTTTTLAPQTGSDFNSYRTNNFQRNNYNNFPSTTAEPRSFPSTAFAPTSRRQPFNNRRTFQTPPPYQASADDDKESLNTAQSANFGSSDEYQNSNAFRRFNNKAQANYTKTYFSSTQAPASYQTIDRGNNRAQAVNTETTAPVTTRSSFRFPQNDRTNSGFSASTAATPTTRGNNNYQSGNTYSNPIPSNSGTQAGASTRSNNGFVNRTPVTTSRPQNNGNNANFQAKSNNQPENPSSQQQNEPQRNEGDYDYAYYDNGENFDYEGFEAEAETHFGKTNKASKVTPSVPRN